MTIETLVKCIESNPNFKIEEPYPTCPKPPYCDKRDCPPGYCKQHLYVTKQSLYGYYQVTVIFPHGEIHDESTSLKSLVRAGLRL